MNSEFDTNVERGEVGESLVMSNLLEKMEIEGYCETTNISELRNK